MQASILEKCISGDSPIGQTISKSLKVGLSNALKDAEKRLVKDEPAGDAPKRSFSADPWMQGLLHELVQRTWTAEGDSPESGGAPASSKLSELEGDVIDLLRCLKDDAYIADSCCNAIGDFEAYLTLLQAAGDSPTVRATQVFSCRHGVPKLDATQWIGQCWHVQQTLDNVADDISVRLNHLY